MSGGLAALLDDIAAMAKLAAASVDDVGAAAARASSKAVGVVVDDTAVTPRYVTGFTPDRELPMIKKITIGSLRNKLLFILPLALLLSQFLPWLLTPLLMIGGTYLSFEGAEKLWEKVAGHHDDEKAPSTLAGEDQEKKMTAGAIRTDFILSAEIMVIALNEVATEPIVTRALILIVVALVITVGVYGLVALIVKADDIGLRLTKTGSGLAQKFGRGLVTGMPKFLAVLSVVGTVAMLWVGGHILLVGADELGWHQPYKLVHHAEEWVHHATGPLGAVLGWITNTFFSFVAGLIVGAVVVVVMHFLPFGKKHGEHATARVVGEGEHGVEVEVIGGSAGTHPARGAVAATGDDTADPVAVVHEHADEAAETPAADISVEAPSDERVLDEGDSVDASQVDPADVGTPDFDPEAPPSAPRHAAD